jgi:hypothetical protein
MSMNDMDKVGKEGCFQSATRILRKRKHSDSEENLPKVEKKSFFATISQKLGFSREPPRSILTQNGSNRFQLSSGELNYSYQHDDYASFVTNEPENNEIHPKKRVKFDEENLIVSSIKYQRQQETQKNRLEEPKVIDENASIFSKFVNFTANLF